jgi:cell division protein FtsL
VVVSARPRWWRIVRIGVYVTATVVVVLVLAVFVFPTRTYLEQRKQMASAATEVHVLDEQNSQLAAEATKLQSTAEIEALARQQYHLVRPGEQAFAILPAPTPATTVPPLPVAPHRTGGLWHTLTGWIP